VYGDDRRRRLQADLSPHQKNDRCELQDQTEIESESETEGET
jgi:hypothetical protein